MAATQRLSDIDAELYRRACAWAAQRTSITALELQSACRLSYSAAVDFIARMQADGLLGEPGADGSMPVIA
jgi:hypothetical protein